MSARMERYLDNVAAPQERVKSWCSKALSLFERQTSEAYKKISFTGKSFSSGSSSLNSANLEFQTKGLEDYLNKPLPPLPALPQDPYFEYMFADAGIASQTFLPQTSGRKSSGNDSDLFLNPIDASEFAAAQAGLEVTTRELPSSNSFSKAVATNTKEIIHLHDHTHLDSRKATVGSLAGCEASGVRTHISLTDHIHEVEKQISLIKSADQHQEKRILEPISQKLKVAAHETELLTSACYNPSAASPVKPPAPLTIRKVNKRNAPESFLSKSAVHGAKPEDFEISLISSKKLRITEEKGSHDVQSMRADSVCESPTDAAPAEYDSDNDWSDSLAHRRKRFTSVLTGYPGQFESYESKYLLTRARRVKQSLEIRKVGNPIHPNNVFTHTNYVQDPLYPSMNYTKDDLNRLPVRKLALKHARAQSLVAADLTRTVSEEDLRREGQIECASARLEGVGVGFYRYYQGHLSLEEYKGARMCVCWDACWCSKLCTIYGDVLCPCNKWIILPED